MGCLLWLIVILQVGGVAFGATGPAFIQERDNQVTSGTTSAATFSSPTTAGNLIVVYLIWDNTGRASVSDSLGNTYASAVGPTQWSNGQYSAQIFYAMNLRNGADTVTATFGSAISLFGIVYAHEYSGVLQTAPVDVTAAAAGASGPLDSGSVTTTNDTDLLFAGGVSGQTVTSPGPGYTARSTFQGNMTEDRIVFAKGSYGATASNSSGAWAMQMVAFKGVASLGNASSKTYSTTFPRTENPISEGGNWINGAAVGLDWSNVQTIPGLAFDVSGTGYRDGTALLAGSWGPDQMAQATVRCKNPSSGIYQEVELRLRSALSAHVATGYEINARCLRGDPASYLYIVRWNGRYGNFTTLTGGTGAQYGVTDGDVLKASIIGDVITVYVNGVELVTATDTVYAAGSPGMGFDLANSTAYSDFGFTSFMASDGAATDTTPPSVPANLSAKVISSSEIDLTWSPSTDNVSVAGYQVFRNNNQFATTNSASFADKTAIPGVPYTYAVAAFDAAGNVSAQSSPVVAETSFDADITPPSVPTNLRSSNVTSTTLTVAWSASTDNVAVAGYKVFRDGIQVATTAATSYTDTGLVPSTIYVYTVAAYDTSNNVSAQSQQLIVTTTSAAVTPPSLVQVNQNQISSGASTSVTFNTPTLAGNTIVVYVIWSNAGSISVTDSRGDTFANVSAPVSWGNGYSAQIFYAPKIVGGTDTVTATFRTSVATFGVVYVHEYAGISAINPIDVTTSASGSSALLNSGTATTTSANDLIFGAGVSDYIVTAAGSGFISRDLAYGNITEDKIAGSVGSYAATATHNGQMWGMQMVAFRAAK